MIVDDRYFDLDSDSVFPKAIPEKGWRPLGEVSGSGTKNSIYLIKARGRLYVGSDLRGVRLQDHKRDLLGKRHTNQLMQRVASKYGLGEFQFVCLVKIPKEYLRHIYKIENSYIRLFDVYRTPHGFNLREFSDDMRELGRAKAVAFKFIDPDGKVVEGKNLSRFCEDYDLHDSKISDLKRGTRQHYKGWRLYKPELIGTPFESYWYVDPLGKILSTRSIRDFAKIHSLDADAIYKLNSGKIGSHKGFRLWSPDLVAS